MVVFGQAVAGPDQISCSCWIVFGFLAPRFSGASHRREASRRARGRSGIFETDKQGKFYPENMPAAKMLPFYAEHFSTTEINYSFRRIPSVKTIEGWSKSTPEHFRFSLKAPQRVTQFFEAAGLRRDQRHFLASRLRSGPNARTHFGVTTRKCANCPVREATAVLAGSAIRAKWPQSTNRQGLGRLLGADLLSSDLTRTQLGSDG
jgi:hypothetical protein